MACRPRSCGSSRHHAVVIFFCVCTRKQDNADDCGACALSLADARPPLRSRIITSQTDLIDVRDKDELNDLIGMSNDGCGCVVWFMAPWCGHCHEMAGEFETAAHMHAQENKSPRTARSIATKLAIPARLHNIQGFPTIRHYKDGHITAEYSGPREASQILDWVKEARSTLPCRP